MRILVERDPASAEFRDEVHAVFRPEASNPKEAGMWSDVFIEQELPWPRFLQSAGLHATAIALIWTVSISWIRQQKILDRDVFDRSTLVTYSPQEYLPPLDTGATKNRKSQKGDPAYARQPILSVPPEADNRSQTILAPPNIKLNRDIAMPNIVATGMIAPAVPLDATRAPMSHMVAPETQVVAPAPEVQFAQDRVVQSALKSDVIAPPPEVTQSSRGHVGPLDIGPSNVVAPAPQITLSEQHALATRGKSNAPSGSVQPVGPPPSVAASGEANGRRHLVALGIHPVAPNGPVAVPAGNRQGTFAATPQGKPGGSGTPELAGGGAGDNVSKGHPNAFPPGLHVGAGDAGGREMARLSSSRAELEAHDASVVPNEKATELDRQVFGGKIFHSMALNMPNLNSATGSWVIHFAELDAGKKEGELTAPRSTEKLDPGYPLELMRANVHGMVSLYAVIDTTGKVTSVRVLNSPDDRLDSYAAKALSLCKFRPAERDGKPVALEALVMIPFRAKRSF